MRSLAQFSILALVLLCPRQAFATLREIREVHYQMGTFLELTLWHAEPERARHLIRASVQEAHRLEEILSDYIPDSAVSQFNANAGKGRVALPPELHELLRISQRLSVRTAGYFDVTVGPLMELWRDCSDHDRIPDATRLAQALSLMGYRKLLLSQNGDAELTRSGMKIDLGGIGKGYAVDRIAGRLKAAGVTAALINFGGSSMRAIGAPPGQNGWEVGVQGPAGDLRGVIYLRNLALSTSGSMGRFFTVGNRRYGHLINPKSGMPVSEPRMASVITPSATTAEALTKPLVLLGGKAMSLVKNFPQTEALVIPRTGALFFSSGFRSISAWQELPQS